MHFEEIIKRISRKLKGIAYRLNARCLFFNEDDLYQEAVLYLWNNFKEGNLENKTDSYILQGCYFYLKNYMRKNVKKALAISIQCHRSDDEETDSTESLLAGSFNKPEFLGQLSDKYLAEAIRNNGLSPKEKDIVNFYAEGFTTREIGKRLGISHVMVVKLTRKIREKCLRHTDFS